MPRTIRRRANDVDPSEQPSFIRDFRLGVLPQARVAEGPPVDVCTTSGAAKMIGSTVGDTGLEMKRSGQVAIEMPELGTRVVSSYTFTTDCKVELPEAGETVNGVFMPLLLAAHQAATGSADEAPPEGCHRIKAPQANRAMEDSSSPSRPARTVSGPPTAARPHVVVEHGDHRVDRLFEDLPPIELQIHFLSCIAASKRDEGSTEHIAEVLHGDIDKVIRAYNFDGEVVSQQKARAWKEWLTVNARVCSKPGHAHA